MNVNRVEVECWFTTVYWHGTREYIHQFNMPRKIEVCCIAVYTLFYVFVQTCPSVQDSKDKRHRTSIKHLCTSTYQYTPVLRPWFGTLLRILYYENVQCQFSSYWPGMYAYVRVHTILKRFRHGTYLHTSMYAYVRVHTIVWLFILLHTGMYWYILICTLLCIWLYICDNRISWFTPWWSNVAATSHAGHHRGWGWGSSPLSY